MGGVQDCVIAMVAVLYFLMLLPIATLFVEFGFTDGSRLARLYSHMFIWPVMFGFVALGYFVAPSTFLATYLLETASGTHKLVLLLSTAAILASIVVYLDQMGSPALWELHPKSYRHQVIGTCGESAKNAVDRLFGANYHDVRSKRDEALRKNKKNLENVETEGIVHHSYNLLVHRILKDDEASRCVADFSKFLIDSRKQKRSMTRWIFIPAMWAMTFFIFCALVTLCLIAVGAKQLEHEPGYLNQVNYIFVVLSMVGLWLLQRWHFQRESSSLLSNKNNPTYEAMRSGYMLVVVAYFSASLLLVSALVSVDPDWGGSIILPLIGTLLSVVSLAKPSLVDDFIRLFFGTGSNGATMGLWFTLLALVWVVPLTTDWLLAEHHVPSGMRIRP